MNRARIFAIAALVVVVIAATWGLSPSQSVAIQKNPFEGWEYPNSKGGEVAVGNHLHWATYLTRDKVSKVYGHYQGKMELAKGQDPEAETSARTFNDASGADDARREPSVGMVLLRTTKQSVAIHIARGAGEQVTQIMLVVDEH